jgi:hypothetical protein
LIDHGASLVFHHQWTSAEEKIESPFANIKDHVLLRMATRVSEASTKMKSIITPELIRSIVSGIPDDWLDADRERYTNFLERRLAASHTFEEEAIHARIHL